MKKLILSIVSTGIALFPCLGSTAAQAASWQPIGPEGGVVQAIAFAPSDSRVVYAGTWGGVFRSSDGGSSWTAASNGLGTLYVWSLAVDPHNSAVVYAGTVDAIYKTTSGGDSWRLLPPSSLPFPSLITSLQIDPVRPRILYAVTSSGLFRSADSGEHWTERDAGLPEGAQGSVAALDIDPDHPGTLYAGVSSNTFQSIPMVYKTTDGGGGWTVLAGIEGPGLYAFARQSSTGALYAATLQGLFVTRDGGATWTLVNDLIFDHLVASPSGTLYGAPGSSGVLSSTDGGKTWIPPAPPFPDLSSGGTQALALSPEGTRLLAGSSGRGVYSLSADLRWTQVNRGLRAASVTGLAVSSAKTPLLLVSTLGEGVLVSGDGGASFGTRNSGLSVYGSGTIDALLLTVSPAFPRSLAVGFNGFSVGQSSDGGRHWAVSQPPLCLQIDTLAIDPPALFFSSRSAFYGSSCADPPSCTAKVSRDGGASFACLDGPQAVSAFLVDPAQPAVVYAAAGDVLWKSSDQGEHFTRIASSLGLTITLLTASPAAHQTLYALGDQGGMLKSTDGGVSWSTIGAAPKVVITVVVDPANASLVYVLGFDGVRVGVFGSQDGGASWTSLGGTLPPVAAFNLALDPVRHVLYLGTQGGAWSLALP